MPVPQFHPTRQTVTLAEAWRFQDATVQRAFDIAFGQLFSDVGEFLDLPPDRLFLLCSRGVHLDRLQWLELEKTDQPWSDLYRLHMNAYIYDLLHWNAVDMAGDPGIVEVLETALSLSSGSVLEFGSGLGTMSLFFALCGRGVTSMEINEQLLSFQQWRAERHGVQLAFAEGPMHSFDAVWCAEVVEHLERPAAWVEKAFGWLKPGGLLFLTHTFHKAGGLLPMHLDDIDRVHEFLDELERHFTPLHDHKTLFGHPVRRRREEPLAVEAVASRHRMRINPSARPSLAPGVALTMTKSGTGRWTYSVQKPDDYFQKPVGIDEELYQLLVGLERGAAIKVDARIRRTLAFLTKRRLVVWDKPQYP